MNELEIKRHLEAKGLKIADIIRHFHNENPHLSEKYCNTMIRDLIAGRRWHNANVSWLQANYQINLNKPLWAMSVRERTKLQAA